MARIVPGARTSTFALAGRQGIPLWRFLAVDFVAAALWVTLMLWIGYWGGSLAASARAGTNGPAHGGVFLSGAGATALALKVWATRRATASRR